MRTFAVANVYVSVQTTSPMKKSLIFFAMLLVACDPDDMFNINDTIPTDTVPQQPDPQPVSLVGTPSVDDTLEVLDSIKEHYR